MKKLLAVLLFMVGLTFLPGNALALTAYIPHITGGEAGWIDYLQVNNNTPSAANFTLTLYNSGTQLYSQVISVGGLSRSLIELKSINPNAKTGMITYTEPGLVFRVSYQNIGGGIAEFKALDTLESSIGFYFSDFTTFVQWKGSAIANMGTAPAQVTLYALGGGSILGTQTVTINPQDKVAAVHSAWFNVNLSQIESIIAVTSSSSLCGIAIGGDMAQSRLLFTPATRVSNFGSSTATDDLIGNFKFVYQIISTFTDRITLDTKSGTKTSEGTDIYTGYNAKYSFLIATGAWFPSLSKYIVLCGDKDSPSFTYDYYSFTINSDNTLSGCWKIDSDDDSCYAFIIPDSRKFPLGSWDTLMNSIKSQNIPRDINEVSEKKMAEDQEVQAQRTKVASPLHEDLLTSKIDELKAMIEKIR